MHIESRAARLRIALAASTILASSLAQPTFAQTAAPAEPAAAPVELAAAEIDGGEIIVTAQRRAERLQDVPLSISAISGDALRNAAVTSADRLEQLVPGIRLGRSGSDLRPAIRGTYTENVAANGDPRIGIYVDDIYQSRTSQVPPIVDLQRVEVQKGPQGTLYGRNSFGGNIAFFSAVPTDEFAAGIDGLYGRYNHARLEAFINTPIAPGISFRAAGLYEQDDGYIKNIGTGNDLGREKQWFVRGTLRLAPTSMDDRLEILLRGSYLDLGGSGLGGFGYKVLGSEVDASLITAPGGSITRNGVTYQLPTGFNGSSFTGTGTSIDTRYRDGIPDINGADVGIPTIADPYTVNYAGDVFRDGDQQQYSAVINFDAGPVRLRSISSYTDFELVRTGGSLTPVLLNYSYQQTAARTFTQEIQLLSNDKDSPLQYVLGGYYLNDRVREVAVTNQNRSYVTATAPVGQQYYTFGFNYLPAAGTGLNQTFAYDGFSAVQQKTKSYAGYGQLSYTFFEKLTATAGIRYTEDRKTLLSSRFNRAATGAGSYFAHDIEQPIDYACGGFIPASPRSVSADPTAIAQAYNFVCGSNKDSFTTYRGALDYKFDRNHMVYASYSTGVHSGGFNTGPVTIGGVPTLLPFAPEKVDAYEVGAKNTLLDGTLTFNVAAFYNRYRDLQAQTSIPNPNNPLTGVIALVQNIGKDRAYGLDVEALIRPTDRLTVNIAFNYLNAREIDYAVNTFEFGGAATFCNVTTSCTAASGERNTVQGTPFPNSRTDPNRFVPILDPNGQQIVIGGVPQFKYVIAGKGLDGTVYKSKKAFSPDYTVQMGIAYAIDLGSAGSLTPEVQTYFNGGYILTDLTPDYGNQKAYTKTDLRLTFLTADERFRVQAFVNNIEDTAVITRAVYGNHRSLLTSFAQPRTYGVQVGVRF
ncbi:TonB-dependent receptor [Glacieibacterium frigidum]|uniref:TonB-dependent receptor n=1 Tax=Glacieibacterium frigidum TaxID=2593303 RepID=A0A552UHQ3_9SPHN|nr:TonB-dependent receptor [Glacieibacterium frigidum]TRW17749.1 TonB-dependent receptor [Glacieibacterium frigidum]